MEKGISQYESVLFDSPEELAKTRQINKADFDAGISAMRASSSRIIDPNVIGPNMGLGLLPEQASAAVNQATQIRTSEEELRLRRMGMINEMLIASDKMAGVPELRKTYLDMVARDQEFEMQKELEQLKSANALRLKESLNKVTSKEQRSGKMLLLKRLGELGIEGTQATTVYSAYNDLISEGVDPIDALMEVSTGIEEGLFETIQENDDPVEGEEEEIEETPKNTIKGKISPQGSSKKFTLKDLPLIAY